MDKRAAKKLLLEHKDALETLLKSEGLGDVEEAIEQSKQAAEQGAKGLKKTLVERVKEQVLSAPIAVVEKVSQLGAAGTVAVSAAAVTQVDLAKDTTEVFVAEIANDIVEERFEVPVFIDHFVDFHELNDWGQVVMQEKLIEAEIFVSEVSEQVQTPSQTVSSEDSKPQPVAASDTSEEKSSDEKSEQSEPKPEAQEKTEEVKEEAEEKNSSKDSDQEEAKEDKTEKDQESKTEDKKESEQKVEKAPSEEIKEESNEEVKEQVPIVETPSIAEMDPIKPHDLVNPSPYN
jgi:cobalamin biosynthesis protein CobT